MSFNQFEPVKTFVKINNKGEPNETREYFAWVERKKVIITKDIFDCYQAAIRKERHMNKMDGKYGLVSYHVQDSTHDLGDGITGEETIEDKEQAPVDFTAIQCCFLAKLRIAMKTLDEKEQNVVELLFFQEKTECQVGKLLGVSQQAISKRKEKILGKLKKFLEI